jgi:hypothetical protein
MPFNGGGRILPLDKEKENKYLVDYKDIYSYPVLTRKIDNETKRDLYRYGFANHTGLPVRICILQITQVFKIKRSALKTTY